MQGGTPRVLIVEDDRALRVSLRRALLDIGFEPLQAGDGEEALAILRSDRVDIVLLDLRLPGRDGHDVVHEMRRRGDVTPVVAMSGEGHMGDLVRLLRRGAVDFLAKPFAEEDLRQAMERALVARVGTAAAPPPPLQAWTSCVPAARRRAVDTPPKELSASTASSYVRELVQQVRDKKLTIPVLGAGMDRLMELAGSPSCPPDEVIARLLEAPALAKAVVTAAATTFMPGLCTATLRDAARTLGGRRLAALAIEAAVCDAFHLANSNAQKWVARAWHNARMTARIADALTDHVPKEEDVNSRLASDFEGVYLAALLQNCGELLLLHLLAQEPPVVFSDPRALESLSREIEVQHEDLAASLATAWKMPPMVARLAVYHHRPMTKPEPRHHRVQRELILTAWALALRSGAAYLPNQQVPDLGALLVSLGIEPTAVGYLSELAPRWLER